MKKMFYLASLSILFLDLSFAQSSPLSEYQKIKKVIDTASIPVAQIVSSRILSLKPYKNQFGHDLAELTVGFEIQLWEEGETVDFLEKYQKQTAESNPMSSSSEQYYRIILKKMKMNKPSTGTNFRKELFQASFDIACSFHAENSATNLVFSIGKHRYQVDWKQFDLITYQAIEVKCQSGKLPEAKLSTPYAISGNKIF